MSGSVNGQDWSAGALSLLELAPDPVSRMLGLPEYVFTVSMTELIGWAPVCPLYRDHRTGSLLPLVSGWLPCMVPLIVTAGTVAPAGIDWYITAATLAAPDVLKRP